MVSEAVDVSFARGLFTCDAFAFAAFFLCIKPS